MTKEKETNRKAKKVLDTAFDNDVNPLKVLQAREEAIEVIKEIKNKNESLMFALSVEDTENKHWRKYDHFVKMFQFEIKHVQEYYSLSRAEKHFLLDLGEFLMWQTNLIVDEEDNPLNQTKIAELLDVSVKTVQRNMKALEERCIIYKIQIWNEVYYIVNPYIMFIGQNINIAIPKLFDELGYVNSGMADKNNNRRNRKKSQQKRITVG
jgi:DNA-binding MarR family transcriptional regulator